MVFYKLYQKVTERAGILVGNFSSFLAVNPIPHGIRKSLPLTGGGPPRPPPRISGTLTHRITTLGGNTHLGINSLYRAFHALKINSYCLKMPEIGLKGPTKVFKLKTKISQER